MVEEDTLAGEVNAERWEEFESWLDQIQREYQAFKARSRLPDTVSRPIFRGLSSGHWKLETSLERYFRQPIRVSDYEHLIRVVKPFVETLAGRSWGPPVAPEPSGGEEQYIPHLMPLFSGQTYEFLLHLRHHGFPSPLLDWSASPYVAAFFAYHDAQDDSAVGVSIYAFVEHTDQPPSGSITEAEIHGMSPYTRSHSRHFLQQSRYTVCIKGAERWFVSHEEAFSRGNGAQNVLWRINLPASEKRRALRHLDRYNVNAYSLYASDEGMMSTLAFREIENLIERGLLPEPRRG